jgi:hypothetical protein
MTTKYVERIKVAFGIRKEPLTLSDLILACEGLKASQISSALCYLMRARWVTREKRDNPENRGHKTIWVYTYHQKRLPKQEPKPSNVV